MEIGLYAVSHIVGDNTINLLTKQDLNAIN